MIDLFLALNAIYFAGAFLEGYIVLMATVPTTGLLIITGMSAMLLKAHHEGDVDLLEEEVSDWDEYDYPDYPSEEHESVEYS